MASFYNNYYRPYSPTHFKNLSNTSSHSSTEDKVSPDRDLYNDSLKKNEKSSRYYSFGPINFKNPVFTDLEEPIFEIFGIQLYLDDIIILGLLFFLYQEGVQDEMLYISLILLLIS